MLSTKRFRLALLGAAAVATLGSASIALADPAADSDMGMTHRVYVPSGPFDLPATVCGFPVHVSYPLDNEYTVKTSTAPDGTTTERLTGHLEVQLTNLSNGNTVTLNVSGPATITRAPDGSGTIDGQGGGVLFFGPRTQAALGVPGIDLTDGHLVQQVDSAGHTTALSVDGRQSDGCSLIS
jgi:hypothetical protein